MIIESRVGSDDLFLVNNETDNGCIWKDDEWTHKLGNGKYTYYFEATKIGKGKQLYPCIKALIRVDNDEEIANIIQKEFGEIIKHGHIIPEKTIIVKICDETNI